ncbi:hypothetical protein [Ralstonia mannitolilytica]|uniref:hypothetical protein n=1 Tax=Ralstonia mannitolilytica TaxID=105219 RepID=UPI0028F596F3|nr:hypothetical protein [Ralstonia mannitolilytica]CAJ0740069.1 hypothetical protein R76696_02772 [Ralstonia mannitolilytica]
MLSLRSFVPYAAVICVLALPSVETLAQARLEREGVVLYWGLIPAAIASERLDLEESHGAPSPGGGRPYHLLVALFRADGSRITDAVVRAQLKEVGIVDSPPKYLTPMVINGQVSYGQVFTSVLSGRVYFRVLVKLVDRTNDIEYRISVSPPHIGGSEP